MMTDMLDRRAAIMTAARGWIGTPYRHQASLRNVGADCLGLVRGVWREVMGEEPEAPPAYQPGWAEEGGGEAMADAARRHLIEIPYTEYQAGDVLLFRWRPHLPAKHAGIATGDGMMVHAQEGAAVTEIVLSPWWLRHMAFAFRFPGVRG
jgi:NlpC/P60 family putative phage cell wall peptidase